MQLSGKKARKVLCLLALIEWGSVTIVTVPDITWLARREVCGVCILPRLQRRNVWYSRQLGQENTGLPGGTYIKFAFFQDCRDAISGFPSPLVRGSMARQKEYV